MGKKAVFKLFYFTSIVLTIILAGVTILATYAANTSPEESLLMGALALGTPVLIAINLFLFLYWAVRLRFWVWIPLVALGFCWNIVTTVYQFSKDEQASAPSSALKIATYNVASFGKDSEGYYCKKIAERMAEENVDIICMQEFSEYGNFKTDSIHATFHNWPYYSVPKYDGHKILQPAIYSKYPIIDQGLMAYPETQNCTMYCDIDVDGKVIRIINNHLQTTNVTQSRKAYERELQNSGIDAGAQFALSAGQLVLNNEIKRAQQADKVTELIKSSPYPVLLCGDFNSMPTTYAYRQMKKAGLQDGFQTAGQGYMYTFRYFKRAMRIDYIFHSPTLKGYQYYSPDWDLSSDHNPVFFEFLSF